MYFPFSKLAVYEGTEFVVLIDIHCKYWGIQIDGSAMTHLDC
jgi:hypothetical protein